MNQHQLFTKNYLIDNPKANILFVHGLGEHCQRYAHVAATLNAIGMNVYTFDLRGHGKSEGIPVYVRNVDEYCQDVEQIYATIPKNLPFFILGHSMGGLITVKYLLNKKRPEVKGVVLSGSAIEVGEDVTPITQKIIQFLAMLFPKLKTVKLDPTSISRDTETVENYKTDPLIYRDGAKAGLGAALLRAIGEVKTRFVEFDYPVLIMHGGADKITNPKGSKDLYAQSSSQNKTLQIWDGAYHEIFNETNRAEVLDFTAKWLKGLIPN